MTPEERAERLIRQARLLDELTLLVLCVMFYGTGRILGLIPPPPVTNS